MKRQPRAEETRSHLLEAAAVCFGQQGYNAASVAEICHQAGVSKGAFYHHFSSKHELFLQLMDSWLVELNERLDGARVGAVTVPEALMSMVEGAEPVFQMADQYIPIFVEFNIQASRDPAVWSAAMEPHRRYHTFFAELFEAGVAEGSLNRIDSAVASRVLVSLALGLLLQGMINPDREDWAQVAKEGVRMLLDGLRTGANSDHAYLGNGEMMR
jgi:AcrR family transcriptional regulator